MPTKGTPMSNRMRNILKSKVRQSPPDSQLRQSPPKSARLRQNIMALGCEIHPARV